MGTFGPMMAVFGLRKITGSGGGSPHHSGQDRRQQPHVGQRPLPAGEGRGAERMLGDFPGYSFVRLTFDADEGDPVGAGDSTEAHSHSLMAGPAATTAAPRDDARQGVPLYEMSVQHDEIAVERWPDVGYRDRHGAALVDAGDRADRDAVRQRIHQRRSVSHPDVAQ